jgi:hypothetical protein
VVVPNLCTAFEELKRFCCQKRLLALIQQATGKAVYMGDVQEEGEDVEADDDTVEAHLTMAPA